MRATNVVLNVMSLLLVLAGLALVSTFFLPSVLLQPAASEDSSMASSGDFDVPVLTEETTPAPTVGKTDAARDKSEGDSSGKGSGENNGKQGEKQKGAQKEAGPAVPVPEDKTLWVTVPKMNRIQSAPMPDTVGDDEETLKAFAGIHLKGTGFPWQEEANVYIAGHRLGYPNTNSFLAFWDLDNVEKGDEVYVTDALGRSYTYRVFKEFVVKPTDIFITKPVEGKNIITLQTCTLPDYSQRLIVQAEKVT